MYLPSSRGVAHVGVSGLDQIAEQSLTDLYLPVIWVSRPVV